MIKLNLGCGDNILDGYINVDLYNDKADIKDDITSLINVSVNSVKIGTVDEIYSSHSLMCVPENRLKDTLKLWHSFLKEGGRIVIETTDFEKQMLEYSNDRNNGGIVMRSLFGDNIQDGMGLRYQFDYWLLKSWLERSGFKDVKRIDQPSYSKHNPTYNLCVQATK